MVGISDCLFIMHQYVYYYGAVIAAACVVCLLVLIECVRMCAGKKTKFMPIYGGNANAYTVVRRQSLKCRDMSKAIEWELIMANYGNQLGGDVRVRTKRPMPPIGRPNVCLASVSEAAVMEAVAGIMHKFEMPGCIVSVRRNNNILAEFALGKAVKGNGAPPMTTDMYFRIGSVTKTMTATAIVLLCDRGLVSLDDTIDKWFPSFPNASRITVMNLLNMTSGLGDYGASAMFGTIFEGDPRLHWDVRDLERWAKDEAPTSAPNAQWHYCNTNYLLLGLMIEMLTGVKLCDAFKHLLFTPLRMSRTYLASDACIAKPHAHGYGVFFNNKYDDCTNWNPTWGYAAGAVVSNVDDLQRWAQSLGRGALFGGMRMHVNELINQSSIETLKTTHFERNRFFYGLGVMYDEEWLWHNGSIPGWETVCASYAPFNLSIVISVNQTTLPKFASMGETSVTQIFRRLTEMYIPDVRLHLAPH